MEDLQWKLKFIMFECEAYAHKMDEKNTKP
jgi:hypothetical protein